jgi:hypothetical protein
MRKLLTSLTVLAALACAGVSQATNGTVDLSWDQCSPVIVDKTSTGPGPFTMIASESGLDQALTGYEIRVIYGDANQFVPEAWQFNAAGCQGSGFVTLNQLPPAALSKVCPPLQGAAASLQIKDVAFTPPSDPYATTTMRIVLANAFPSGNTPTGGRYFLMSAVFDHTFSVAGPGTPGSTCGGYETPICFKLSVSTWADINLVLNSFDRGNSVLTFNGGAACAGVPARASTWGSIKGQYRQ